MLLLVWLGVRVLPPLYYSIHYPAVTLWVVYSFWFALLKEEGYFQACFDSSHFQPLQSSPLHSWNPTSLTIACHCPTSLALQGRGESLCYSSPCLLAHLVMKRQGCLSNQSHQGQGPGVREHVDFQYDTGLDLCLGMSKIFSIRKCLQEFMFIVFTWPCRPNTVALEIRAEQSWEQRGRFRVCTEDLNTVGILSVCKAVLTLIRM